MAVDPVAAGARFWREVFGKDGPVEVEIGPGSGSFLLAAARAHPDVHYLGIESSRSRAQRLQETLERAALTNARILHAPAQCVVRWCIPECSVTAFHIYFPDPWWKRRHHRRRLLTSEFAAAVERALLPGGRIFLATDVPLVAALAREVFGALSSLVPDREAVVVRPQRTRFEEKARRRGAPVEDLVFRKAPWLAASAA